MFKKIPLRASLVFLLVLMTLNIVYYQHTKEIIIQNQKEKMLLLYNSVRMSIEQTAAGEKFVEDLIGQNLRSAAIASQFKLDPDIDKVDNSDLVELSKQLGVDQITLFQKKPDDIVGAKSSDPKDLNVSSKGWDTIYIAFHQLFDLQNVNVGMGQALPHYWSAPFDTATSNPESINKWGYYFDGTTNYIINPFVQNTDFRIYQSVTGVEDAIRRLTKEHEHMRLEISVLNSDKLLDRQYPAENPTPSHWYSERLVLFGQYQYRDSDEKKYAQMALDTNQTVFYTTSSEDKTVFKSFTPIHKEFMKYNATGAAPLIEISYDYTEVEQLLQKQLQNTLFFMLICTGLSLAIITFMFILYNRKKERAVQDVQDAYAGNMETLFQSIREQRHDFINHIQTINAFLTLKHYEELHSYTKTLVGEIRVVNDLVNINNPPLIALFQAKLTQAERQRICFEHAFNQMEKVKFSPVKATDMVKLLSNLIDNAFDATMELDQQYRYVKVEGDVNNQQLQLRVVNRGNPIPSDIQRKMFESGFTSKHNGKNSGLGLYIVHQLVERYQGSIQLNSENGMTEFNISIPLKGVL
ncbi:MULTISPECIES: ATP-binding protein [unclassified Paenibacillus]|uniref:sensor histidine kinase n=1 Tax=unclassified Paenibacillus TaxID=185978 RepID=UPI001AE8FACA|nr:MULTISPECIES: ATP-binding protein [unclassified Paenibacillus]MBP1154507.1 signal transduction histidine kinase [Paenibacillus sp. PvP091]MBP1170109.1 signal transduction histidine kinase [Paenibacillus sp. PvR098]MBP2441137.1 signal transduction histidine kinase [Paenibacillus sp. PvP052]